MKTPPFTVALLDDDPSVLKAMTRLLRSAGWTVTAFEDPPSLLEHAAAHPLPVAVIDVSMPVMNGLEVQARLRKLSPDTEIVFLTSRDDSSTRESALTGGAFAYLLKPADDDEFLSVIESATGQR
jgi:CheY-like chemotaxis protein